jgi:hypothetical protein
MRRTFPLSSSTHFVASLEEGAGARLPCEQTNRTRRGQADHNIVTAPLRLPCLPASLGQNFSVLRVAQAVAQAPPGRALSKSSSHAP